MPPVAGGHQYRIDIRPFRKNLRSEYSLQSLFP